jgi:hypothetical protein
MSRQGPPFSSFYGQLQLNCEKFCKDLKIEFRQPKDTEATDPPLFQVGPDHMAIYVYFGIKLLQAGVKFLHKQLNTGMCIKYIQNADEFIKIVREIDPLKI